MADIYISEEPKRLIFILNQIFEIEKQMNRISKKYDLSDENSYLLPSRNINKLKEFFESSLSNNISLTYHDPTGEDYNETRTDCCASIAGEKTDNLKIIDVMKPIIRISDNGINRILQKAVVIVKSENE